MKTFWYHILLALAAGPLHGAEIRRRVERDGGVPMYPAMLYGSLDELLGEEWIEEADVAADEAGSSRWRFYRLTPAGRRALEAETGRLESIVRLARKALAGG